MIGRERSNVRSRVPAVPRSPVLAVALALGSASGEAMDSAGIDARNAIVPEEETPQKRARRRGHRREPDVMR